MQVTYQRATFFSPAVFNPLLASLFLTFETEPLMIYWLNSMGLFRVPHEYYLADNECF